MNGGMSSLHGSHLLSLPTEECSLCWIPRPAPQSQVRTSLRWAVEIEGAGEFTDGPDYGPQGRAVNGMAAPLFVSREVSEMRIRNNWGIALFSLGATSGWAQGFLLALHSKRSLLAVLSTIWIAGDLIQVDHVQSKYPLYCLSRAPILRILQFKLWKWFLSKSIPIKGPSDIIAFS